MFYKFLINKKNLAVFIFILIKTTTFSQTAHKMLREGDASYKKENYKTAEENYRKSLETQPSSKGDFNLGNAIFKQQRFDDAIKQYDGIANNSSDNSLKSSALYNKGNAHFWKKEYDKAVEAYKEALRLNPKDEDAKTNLAKAKRMLQEQQKQQQKQQNQQNQQQNQKDKKDEQKKNEQNEQQNQQQQPQDQQQQNQQQNKEPDKQPQQNPQQQPQQDLKKEEAKRMLQIMDDEERKVQQRLKKGKQKPSRSSKDW